MELIKAGVSLTGLSPEMVLAYTLVSPVLRDFGQEPVITSALDGKHKRNSAHYTGNAIDLRIWDLDDPERCVVVMQQTLGNNYDVILESDHIHLEFDPETGAG